MKSSLFLGMPAVVTVLNLLFAIFIIRRHHGMSLLEDVSFKATLQNRDDGDDISYHRTPSPMVNTYTNHYYPQPTRNSITLQPERSSATESPSVSTSTMSTFSNPTIPKQHVSPTKWSLSRSSLANHRS
jgi:hypothetical protein